MWLPYSGAVLMKLDMRWVTVLCLLLSFGGFLLCIADQEKFFLFLSADCGCRHVFLVDLFKGRCAWPDQSE